MVAFRQPVGSGVREPVSGPFGGTGPSPGQRSVSRGTDRFRGGRGQRRRRLWRPLGPTRYLAELAVHAWDLASATGQLDRLDPAPAVSALDGARAMIRPQYRDMVATGSPFGVEIPPPPDADDWERLVAFTGRDPRAALDG